MKDPNNKDKPSDREWEAAIRKERKFSLTEAIGRQAGGALKGASPVTAAQQMVLQIEEILAVELPDSEGSLTRTIVTHLEGNPPLLARHFGHPRQALLEFLDELLASGARLEAFVRQTDARWGRDYAERPHFERDGRPPHADDPYTIASVRGLLKCVQSRLKA